MYSAIEHASDDEVGTFCGSNNRSVSVTFYTLIFLFGILWLLFSTMKIWYKGLEERTESYCNLCTMKIWYKGQEERAESIKKSKYNLCTVHLQNIVFYLIFIFITFSFLLYMLEDNNQPLICHFNHTDTDLEPAGRELYTKTKIGISVSALITAVLAFAFGCWCV